MKTGYKTTEFWVTVVTSILTLLNQSGFIGTPLPVEAIAGIVGLVATYALSRGLAKKDADNG
jgi:hypothetical protein